MPLSCLRDSVTANCHASKSQSAKNSRRVPSHLAFDRAMDSRVSYPFPGAQPAKKLLSEMPTFLFTPAVNRGTNSQQIGKCFAHHCKADAVAAGVYPLAVVAFCRGAVMSRPLNSSSLSRRSISRSPRDSSFRRCSDWRSHRFIGQCCVREAFFGPSDSSSCHSGRRQAMEILARTA